MSGVFLSYSRADRAFADQIIRSLAAVGVNVWRDEDMPGVDRQLELERKLGELAAVAVLWTPTSASSPSVRDEARLGLETDKLLNVLSGVEKPPFPFDRLNGIPLDGWTGREPHRQWTRLVETIEALVVRSGGAQAGEITEALKRRDRAFRSRQQALARAEEEMDTARTAREEADLAHQAAKAQVLRAARALSEAQADLDGAFSEPSEPLLNPLAKSAQAQPRVAELATVSAGQKPTGGSDAPASPPGAPSRRAAPKPSPPPPPQTEPQPEHAIQLREPLRLHRPATLQLRSQGPWIALAAVAGIVVIGWGLIFSHHPNAPHDRAKPSSAVSKAPHGFPDPSAVTQSPAIAMAIGTANALAGSWASQGLTCDDRQNVTLSVTRGVLNYAAAGTACPFIIEPSREPGVLRTMSGKDQYSFSLDRREALSMVGPNGTVRLTRCAG